MHSPKVSTAAQSVLNAHVKPCKAQLYNLCLCTAQILAQLWKIIAQSIAWFCVVDRTLREGCQEQMLPKCRHCLNGGGSDPCLDFCEGFVHMHWGPSKVIIHHPEVIISKQRTVLKYNNNQFQFIEINYWPLQIFSEFSQQHVTCCWTVMHQMTMFTPH